MINKLVGVATLFTASAVFVAGAPQLHAAPLASFGSEAALMAAGDCGDKDMKKDAPKDGAADKAPAKAKDGSCGKGSCGKDMKKGKKDGTCGKDAKAKKDGTCGKDKKEASCGKDKK